MTEKKDLKKLSMIDKPEKGEKGKNDPRKKDLLPEEEGYGLEEYIEEYGDKKPPKGNDYPNEHVQGI